MIFTSNKITVYGKIKGNAPDEIEIITYGGEIEDKFQVWSHERTLNLNDKGYFFRNYSARLRAEDLEKSYYFLGCFQNHYNKPLRTYQKIANW